ncbi:glycosyltransferase family 2 protein [Chitinophaga agrisoli]|nr:glycosyltransferase [Chitinophaga agrisoli]
MGLLLYYLLNPVQIGYAPFYWLLMAAVIFNCLRVLHEWYHYFYITVPPTPPLTKKFTVDIFTTFCAGEPYPMIVETLEAIQAIHYPHTTYLCDEADDPYLKEVCRRLGVHHVTRTDKRDAKAGNINNALLQSTGELCVVLDPDHVPRPDFLDPIIPHFNDAAIGFVQIVQAYSNQGDSLIARGAAQQTFQFYGPMMMTMNRYGTVLAIGANCTFRRTALESIGGHAAGLSEDMHTAMQLHAKGWRSVYVPEVLTYGLVPSTLSAYYKQQLKWARGTFELLVTSYPRLFKHFTWRQRLHYGTIPFHYFSGVIFLINFLVPMLSLVLGEIPLRVDLLSFTLAGLPFICATLAIRHFVQRWVMGEDERGNHIVGGLLLIGAWWIYILGLFYTIIRKKIPYIPTPKDDSEPDKWQLNIPNLVIALCSAAAIVYGLYTDWNPFAWVMAGIAGINCAIMLFNVIISRRHHLQRFKRQSITVQNMVDRIAFIKLQFWFFRHAIYNGLRRFALLLLICIFTGTILFMAAASKLPTRAGKRTFKHNIFYTGIFSPATQDGLTSIQQVKGLEEQYKFHCNIISLYIPWGDEPRCLVPQPLVDSIYRNGSYPMITWEPWGGLFSSKTLNSDQQLLARISQGSYDHYLHTFAAQLKQLNRPVLLRFAHEADNPFYPWSASGGNTAEDFKQAWRYVHDLFAREGAYNVVWVWNPWQPQAVNDYFPGSNYVDWLAVPGLNYGTLHENGKSHTFKDLYAPFHRLPIFRSGLPVMIAETGSLRGAANQEKWLEDALTNIDTAFKEIKALVLFNSDMDRNMPQKSHAGVLNWKPEHPAPFFTSLARYYAPKWHGLSQQNIQMPQLSAYNHTPGGRRPLPDTLRGVNYQKGQHWYRNLHALTRREIVHDFTAMKQLGINTIIRNGPGVYDRNILAVARQCDIKICYSFAAPTITDLITDSAQLYKFTDKILKRIQELKDDRSIIAWNIGDTLWQQLSDRFYKPGAIYQQYAYAAWLRKLVTRIKALDPVRPVTMDVRVNNRVTDLMDQLEHQLPEIDAFGLVFGRDTTGMAQLSQLKARCYISQVSVIHYAWMPASRGSIFINSWQDIGDRDYLTFDGLVDHWGRYKVAWYQLRQRWTNVHQDSPLPPVKILRPAALTTQGNVLTYRAITWQQRQWKLAATDAPHDMVFEWRLVRTDQWGNPVLMEYVGKGTELQLRIPGEPHTYRLYLSAYKGNDVTTAQTLLNTPL